MGINSRFAVAIHILALLEINRSSVNTSEWIAQSVNTNPVVIRRIMGMLNKAGLVTVRPGVAGAKLARDVDDITLHDVYKAVSGIEQDELFSVHEAPSPDCPVGRNIHNSIVPLFSVAQRAMEEVLKNMTLKQVTTDIAGKEHGG